MRSRAIFLAVAMLAAVAHAQVAVHARRLLDVRTGNVSDAFIIVRGDRIESIAHAAPAGATVTVEETILVTEDGAEPLVPWGFEWMRVVEG